MRQSIIFQNIQNAVADERHFLPSCIFLDNEEHMQSNDVM
jgi:hypothetical protein